MTSNVSKKTSYLVVGEEAGESKLAKVCSQPRCASSISSLGCPICAHVLACICYYFLYQAFFVGSG